MGSSIVKGTLIQNPLKSISLLKSHKSHNRSLRLPDETYETGHWHGDVWHAEPHSTSEAGQLPVDDAWELALQAALQANSMGLLEPMSSPPQSPPIAPLESVSNPRDASILRAQHF